MDLWLIHSVEAQYDIEAQYDTHICILADTFLSWISISWKPLRLRYHIAKHILCLIRGVHGVSGVFDKHIFKNYVIAW